MNFIDYSKFHSQQRTPLKKYTVKAELLAADFVEISSLPLINLNPHRLSRVKHSMGQISFQTRLAARVLRDFNVRKSSVADFISARVLREVYLLSMCRIFRQCFRVSGSWLLLSLCKKNGISNRSYVHPLKSGGNGYKVVK